MTNNDRRPLALVIGVPLASLIAKALTSALFGVKPYDGLSYSLAVCGVAFVAIVASLIPAHRAANVDPLSDLTINGGRNQLDR